MKYLIYVPNADVCEFHNIFISSISKIKRYYGLLLDDYI